MSDPLGNYFNLSEYVEMLLKQGKRSQDPEFKTLMLIYGREKIVEMAKEWLQRDES